MPRCFCWKFSLSTFGWCCCCCTVPISNEKLPLLDTLRIIPTSFDNKVPINQLYITKSYLLSKNKEIEKSRIRIVTLSDTHMYHENYSMPEADILIIAGDLTNWRSTKSNIQTVIEWIATLKQYKYKIVIAGNHEVELTENNKSQTVKLFKEQCNAIYLQDDVIELFGLTIYGTPWHPKRGCFFHAEAFGKPTKRIKKNI
eukprot:UN00665